MEESFYSS
jgi:hypothetical protein